MSAADIIGILGFTLHAIHKVCDAVEEVKKAPQDIKALRGEIQHVQELLNHFGIDSSRASSGSRSTTQAELKRLVELSGKGEELIATANRFVQRVTKRGDDGTRKVKKAQWLFNASEAKELAEDFKAFHRALADVCSVNTYAMVHSMESNISALRQTISSVDERVARAVEQQITPAMERLLDEERVGQILVRSLAIVAQQQREGRHQLFDKLTVFGNSSANTPEHPAGFLSITEGRKDSPTFVDGEPSPSEMNASPDTKLTPTSRAYHPSDMASESIRLQDSRLRPPSQRCPPNCNCRCHKPSSAYRLIPRPLRLWLGDIHIHEGLLTSLMSSTRPCDDVQCMQTMESLSAIRWWLPTWFAEAEFKLRFQSLPIHFLIQTPRIVGSLGIDHSDSLQDLKIKLSTREITVNDVERGGYSILHHVAYMIITGHEEAHEMMHYLVEAGAPQDWEHGGLTVTERVIASGDCWLGHRASAPLALQSFVNNVARPLLREDIEDVWESIRTKRGWSDLHYLLANPPKSPLRLRSELTRILTLPSAVSYLNALDRFGQTPLFQAVVSCPEAVDALLRAGANALTRSGLFVNAVRTASWNAIGPLVRAGDDVNDYCHLSSGYMVRALHEVIRFWSPLGPGRRLPLVLELMRHGGHLLNWNVKYMRRYTLLSWAKVLINKYPNDEEAAYIYKLYQTRQVPFGAQLIDVSRLEAGMEAIADFETTSLIKAGLTGSIQALSALIDAGAMVNERDATGRTLLHLVATGLVPNGYTIAIELIRQGGYGVDWNAQTVDGQTAEELAHESHRLVSPEDGSRWQETFDILHLLQRRALPEGMDYVYPCMHPEYCWRCSARPCSGYCSDGLRMPGQW